MSASVHPSPHQVRITLDVVLSDGTLARASKTYAPGIVEIEDNLCFRILDQAAGVLDTRSEEEHLLLLMLDTLFKPERENESLPDTLCRLVREKHLVPCLRIPDPERVEGLERWRRYCFEDAIKRLEQGANRDDC